MAGTSGPSPSAAAEGYRFAVAGDGAEMRRIIRKGEIDVCIIDFLLPGGENGLVLAKEVAAEGYGVMEEHDVHW